MKRRRAVMVDVDGVLIVHPNPGGWAATLERDLGVTRAAVQEAFFKPHWDDVSHGRASLRERLTPVLEEIAPSITYDRFIEYWFSNDAHVDHRLLAELETLRRDGVEVHLATVQEHERARFIWERLGFQSRFDGMHHAAALGCSKPAADFYRSIETRTGLAPEAIFFIDDKAENVAGARACGWTAALWTGEHALRAVMADQRWNVG
jgi:putative hydrolase of the HAD superfamily